MIPSPAETLLHPCPEAKASYSLSKRDVKPEIPCFCIRVCIRDRLPVRSLCAYVCTIKSQVIFCETNQVL